MAYINGKKILFCLSGGYEQGQADKNRELWDLLIDNNTRDDISKLFQGSGFEYIRPPYKITPTGNETLSLTFYKSKKLKKIESAYFDFSNKKRGTTASTALYYTFNSCTNLEEIEDVGLQPDHTLTNTFSWSGIKKIACIRVDENTMYNKAFTDCAKLEEVIFDGVIGQNGLSFVDSPLLSKDSLMNIINCLMAFVIAENKELTATANSMVLKDAKIIQGKLYSMQYKSQEYDGVQATISTLAEFSQDMTASVINIPNVGERVGVWQQCAHWADPDISWYKVYIYQDGDDIKELRCIVNKQTGKAHALVYDGDVLSIKVDQTATHTVTFGETNLAKLTDSEKAIATEKGWTLA